MERARAAIVGLLATSPGKDWSAINRAALVAGHRAL